MNQPEIKILNNLGVTKIIQNGALIFNQELDYSADIAYEAILVDDKLAYFKYLSTNREIYDLTLLAIVNSYVALRS